MSSHYTILTLDAGGTNFVFSAIKEGYEITEPITLSSCGDDLEKSLSNIITGFSQTIKKLNEKPSAISFAFPGPADYPNGIIGDLGNLPAFKGGVPLKALLEEIFNIPVFINNDGDLFAYGESIVGFLGLVNKLSKDYGYSKSYTNLLGITIGTGLGAGIVFNNNLYIGDNSSSAELWITRNSFFPKTFIEESISIRAIQNTYYQATGKRDNLTMSPKDIYEIAKGEREGNKHAALFSFESLGNTLGDILANTITLLDCNVVIGGGLSNAYSLFAPAMFKQLNGKLSTFNGSNFSRLSCNVYDFENDAERASFFNKKITKVNIPYSNRTIDYDPNKRIAIGTTKLGTSRAIAIGAYYYAINHLSRMKK